MSMRCEKFQFFHSYYLSAKLLDSEEKQRKFILGLLDYAFTGEEPELQGELKAMFELARPNIDKSISYSKKASDNGKLGGAPKGNKNASKAGNKTTNSLLQNKLDKDKDMEKDKEIGNGYSACHTEQAGRAGESDIDFGSFSK